MFRSRYDGDATTFSPEGRILQVENAMKAVQQGMPTVAIRSKTHAVLACIMHNPSEFSSYQPKIFKIDDHIGVSISGLTADGRGLCKLLRNECIQHKFAYGSEIRVVELADIVAERSQKKTQKYDKRPYGVGLLMIGSGSDGVRLFETCPSGQNWEFNAQAIGRRAQAGKTYLEQHLAEFKDCDREGLIRHALKAINDCSSKEEINLESLAVGVVGIDEPFEILEGEQLRCYIDEN
ncbi:20S proteasome subunit alpha type 1 [Histomonas meleagridis]|uniref:20S proteasome subunit alpha type 1 n=1 Tax=Histomonas meleagridis TaxID=135588 RepID=UPI003559D247|nr:20S proteasome subunit alpha type 1 [Histomonas meleagridis]KAH0806455.1 20S proteasome subunit alpha type 1 [Histomonas meleagridis]